ncbi:MAG: PIN domain-containing protein [Hydrogenophilales bacterium CG03_land_8_20_14_0_80_62_28]|nr:type II toxin-antitoxin system VapC family toxin [Betaproteobacteria bacterium]PIV22519.1 MAG: PIN domain-containing protein [Hydrogenophilales bacterium CG03_land_8_20_14_0_80_62_28]PIW38319.1 MAG: PIN domain-containing protein [Hydrogenophilales bacterium CG15_BIG_FIL_POST_REV_8_21_14_020_62_31]PIW72188.1 MAG: PIN domain-containing protein [Hydrogenophilales bacterium CG12_big_fil_rev_8_21_14_0_65_61_21]PIX02337.1 MAG: PIN domain-containing protein [Hydrogenophilales bacterium CG_4_8_14_3_
MLVDTNIVSELVRRQPNAGVLAWADGLADFAISVVTVDEIAYGLSWRPNARIEAWFDGFLRRHPIFPVTEAIARRAGELRGAFAARGIKRSQADMMIAATAQIHALTLATRNEDDFRGCGIPVLNPFSP